MVVLTRVVTERAAELQISKDDINHSMQCFEPQGLSGGGRQVANPCNVEFWWLAFKFADPGWYASLQTKHYSFAVAY